MNSDLVVEEFQGLYGPFNVSELVLQRIWLESAFDATRLRDGQGRQIETLFPGDWNRLDGPDFKSAALLIDGERVEGDVEIHFSDKDWYAHGHHENAAFDDVVLHVVYHPVAVNSRPTKTRRGQRVPTISLMDLLWYDLEAYAVDDSLQKSTGVSNEAAVEMLLVEMLWDRRASLISGAKERWREKLRFATHRIEALGWESACHTTALEIMGYRANRIPMLRVAGEWPLERVREQWPSWETLWNSGGDLWSVSGTRPANHPRARVEQYLKWVESKPNWPDLLLEHGSSLPEGGKIDSSSCPEFRKRHGLRNLQSWFHRELAVGSVSSSKLNTLVCDGFLPLLAARLERDYGALWFHWYPGDAPESLQRGLKRLEVVQGREHPAANGWIQGLLQRRLEEQHASLGKG